MLLLSLPPSVSFIDKLDCDIKWNKNERFYFQTTSQHLIKK